MKFKHCLILLTLLAPLSSVPAAAAVPSPSITVSGDAVLRVDPDIATVSLTAEMENPDKAKLNEELQNEVSAFTDYLIRELKLKKEDIIAQSINIYPRYDYSDKDPILRGYEGSRAIRVTVGDFNLISVIVTKAMDSKGITVNSVNYGLKDPAGYAEKARNMAISDSIHKARSIASRYNARLLHIESVNYNQNSAMNTVEYVQSNRMMTKSMGVSKSSAEEYYQAKKIELRDSIEVKFAVKAGSLDQAE